MTQHTLERIRQTSLTSAMLNVMVWFALFAASTTVTYGNVLVEGNCEGSQTATTPGTCGDYDGDGRLGTAEDADADRMLGTITAALERSADLITIVTSGTFSESLTITAQFGNVTLQAAPGVAAVIRRAGRVISSSGFESLAITINVTSSDPPYVVLRNLHLSSWEGGIRVRGNSRVAIEDCRLENHNNFGIRAEDNAKVTITDTKVHVTGTDNDSGLGPSPTYGIVFLGRSSGSIFSSTVSGTFVGIGNLTGMNNAVCAYNVNVFDNIRNFENVTPSPVPCGSPVVKGRTFSR